MLHDGPNSERVDTLAAMADIPLAESVRAKHVLIVGINYAPEPTGIAPYTTRMAEHLARSAASVTVLAGLPCYPAWRVEPDFAGHRRIDEKLNGVDLIRLRHHVPVRQTALRRGAYEASFMAHVALTRLPQEPDVVIAVTPALGGVVAASRIARRHGAPFVVVVQDLMGRAAAQSGIAGGSSVAGVTGWLERRALTRANRVAVVSQTMRPVVESYGVAPTAVTHFPNWSHIDVARRDRLTFRAELGWSEGVTVALHTGNMGLKQDLGNIIEAARLSQGDPSLLWVLMGDGSQRQSLVQQATGLPNLVFMSPASADTYPDVLAAADVLLLNERHSVSDMSLPSKLTSYLMSGRPLAAAVAAKGATQIELTRSSAALCVATAAPFELHSAVARLARDPEFALQLGRNGLLHAQGHLTESAAMGRLNSLLAL